MTSVDVCICTFQRPSIRSTLESLVTQEFDGNLRVIVADNDFEPHRRADIVRLGKALGLQLKYVHAPAQNISVARNACLSAATADWLAFIDDDEIAAPSWLAELLNASDARDIVFGVSKAVYSDDTPTWICEGDFHSAKFGERDPPWNGYTGNVLIRRSFLARSGLRFQNQLGQIGGEDTVFFYQAMRAGARIRIFAGINCRRAYHLSQNDPQMVDASSLPRRPDPSRPPT